MQNQSDLKNIFLSTIEYGIGQSVLILGPRGAGKSKLIQNTLEDLTSDEEIKLKIEKGSVVIVFADASLGDDRAVLREIARDLQTPVPDQNLNPVLGPGSDSLSENSKRSIDSLSLALPNLLSDKKAIIIINEAENLINKRQNLLYTLFDTAATNGNLCIVCVTTLLTWVESLEKRVLSRFSRRILTVFAPSNLNDFREICEESLNSSINKNLDYDLKNLLIEKSFYTTKNPLDAIYPIKFYPSISNLNTELSSLELQILIAATRICHSDSISTSFSIAYNEYLSLANSFRHTLSSKSTSINSLSIFSNELIEDDDDDNNNSNKNTLKKLKSRAALIDSLGLGAGFKIFPQRACLKSWENLLEMGLISSTSFSDNISTINSAAPAISLSSSGAMYKVNVTLSQLRQIAGQFKKMDLFVE